MKNPIFNGRVEEAEAAIGSSPFWNVKIMSIPASSSLLCYTDDRMWLCRYVDSWQVIHAFDEACLQ